MSTPKDINAYPGWFLSLAGEFEPPSNTRRKVYIVETKKEALYLRLQFYGFMRALKRSGSTSYPNFLSARLVIRDNELHIVHADEYLRRPTEKLPE